MANDEVMKDVSVEHTENVTTAEADTTKDLNTTDTNQENEETVEYETFTYSMGGITREWAITEEFEYERKNYIVCGEVVGDSISEEGLYLFEGTSEGEEITVKNIDTEEEYNRIVDAYCALCEEKEEQ